MLSEKKEKQTKKKLLELLLGTDRHSLPTCFLKGLREKHDMPNIPHVSWGQLFSLGDFRAIPYTEDPAENENSIWTLKWSWAFLQVQMSKNT